MRPAGLTAALYAARAGKTVTVYERECIGGQITRASLVENYPGTGTVSGLQLGDNMAAQAEAAGAGISITDVQKIVKEASGIFRLDTDDGEYKHRSAMDLPTKAAWPVRRYVVFRCRGFSPCLYTRERVLRSLESPFPLFTYRIAYFSQKNNRQDIRIPTFGFVLIYELCLFVLYVLTNRLLV